MRLTNLKPVVAVVVARDLTQGLLLEIPNGAGGTFKEFARPRGWMHHDIGTHFLVSYAERYVDNYRSLLNLQIFYPCDESGNIPAQKIELQEKTKPFTVLEKGPEGVKVAEPNPWTGLQVSAWKKPKGWEQLLVGEVAPVETGAGYTYRLVPIR